jgi:hypothetical protein
MTSLKSPEFGGEREQDRHLKVIFRNSYLHSISETIEITEKNNNNIFLSRIGSSLILMKLFFAKLNIPWDSWEKIKSWPSNDPSPSRIFHLL